MGKILSLLIVLILIISCDNKPKNNVGDLKNVNFVHNYTSHPCDSSVLFILSDVFNYSNINLFIIETKSPMIVGDFNVHACIIKCGVSLNTYYIYFSPNISHKRFHFILCHELVHLYQYQENNLVQISDTKMKYNGEIINLLLTPYEERLYEIDAQNETYNLYKRIKCFI